MRLVLFTDTLHDVNGVSRFIRNIGDQAAARGLDLHIVTSTRLPVPADGVRGFIHNIAPMLACPMPGYPQLELAVPRAGAVRQVMDRLAPHVVHISTPGPVGTVGRWSAARRRIPIVGTYHTDFPAYIDNLFDDAAFTWVCSRHMRWFYRRFARMFTRSMGYVRSMERVGIPADRVVRLLPGIDTAAFSTGFREAGEGCWRPMAPLGIRRDSAKVLYVGRVSVEKNLPLLASAWPAARRACLAASIDAQLLIVGDGPFRPEMQRRLAGTDAVFLGFRHGRELSRIYANSDLFVFPSTTDTLGQVVMEAQSAGLPVIVSDAGGPAEVVDDGVTGLVLPGTAPSAPAWSRTIATLVCDKPKRISMGAAASAKIAPMTIGASFEHFWSVHEEVLKTHRDASSTPRASQR